MSGFQRSQGFLLAGAVAYYTLLAIVPLFVVLLVGLSHVVDEHRLLDTVASNLQLVIPSQAAVVTEQVESFLAHREVVGIVGLLVLVFFSSTAFTVIESAMAIIFYHRTVTQHRRFLVSVLLPVSVHDADRRGPPADHGDQQRAPRRPCGARLRAYVAPGGSVRRGPLPAGRRRALPCC